MHAIRLQEEDPEHWQEVGADREPEPGGYQCCTECRDRWRPVIIDRRRRIDPSIKGSLPLSQRDKPYEAFAGKSLR